MRRYTKMTEMRRYKTNKYKVNFYGIWFELVYDGCQGKLAALLFKKS